tara:strand:- start:122 stop:442 length:321 start_codon:yes stop_codon:yes gene_type:complete
MEIKFILLIIGLFIFTLGYVNQNKYNCNIIPSLDRYQEQDLKKIFDKDDAFLNYERVLKNNDGSDTIIRNIGARPQPIEIGNSGFISQITGGQREEYKNQGGDYGG